MNPLIAIPMGDPAGIGPEIVIKTLADETTQKTARCIVVGSRKVLEYARGNVSPAAVCGYLCWQLQ